MLVGFMLRAISAALRGLSFWVNGIADAARMADDLDCAVHLLLSSG